jgi:hypothetical protein
MTRDDIIRMAREAGFDLFLFFTLAYEAGAAAEREACARLVERDDSMRWSGAADAIRVQAADRLARHGINPCPDCHGVGYDASGQRCWCQQNPSF